jgi:hypothetical protein
LRRPLDPFRSGSGASARSVGISTITGGMTLPQIAVIIRCVSDFHQTNSSPNQLLVKRIDSLLTADTHPVHWTRRSGTGELRTPSPPAGASFSPMEKSARRRRGAGAGLSGMTLGTELTSGGLRLQEGREKRKSDRGDRGTIARGGPRSKPGGHPGDGPEGRNRPDGAGRADRRTGEPRRAAGSPPGRAPGVETSASDRSRDGARLRS